MFDNVPLDELEQRLEDNTREQNKLLRNESYQFYIPIKKGKDFIDFASSGNYITTLLEAANGIGKTMLVAHFLAHLFWPIGSEYFQGQLFHKWPYPKKGRIVSDPNTITETIIPMLKQVFPRGRYHNEERYETTKAGKRYESYWKTDTGFEFNIMTYEQDVKEFESATLGFVWEDEPAPELIHKANIARLRMGGICLMTETPLNGSQWIFDKFADLPPEKLLEQKKAIVHADLEDACIKHGGNGFIEHERIVEMISQYDDDDMQPRVFGKHAHLSGLVFKKYSEKIHIIKPFALTDRDWMVVHALDPHPRVNDAGLWVAFGRDRRIIIVDELWGAYETDELAIRIKGIDKSYRRKGWLIDPSAFVVDKHTGRSLAGDLHNLNLFYDPGSKERSTAIRLIRDVLDYRYINGEWLKRPKLYIFDTCPRTIWELGHWQWENWQGKTAANKSLKEKPMDKDDHMIESLGRILLSGISFEEPQRDELSTYTGTTPLLDPYDKI